MYMYEPTRLKDWTLNQIDNWKLKFSWTPKRCFLSNKLIWGCWSYYGVKMITGPGEPVYDSRWVDRTEFIIWQLKKGF